MVIANLVILLLVGVIIIPQDLLLSHQMFVSWSVPCQNGRFPFRKLFSVFLIFFSFQVYNLWWLTYFSAISSFTLHFSLQFVGVIVGFHSVDFPFHTAKLMILFVVSTFELR